MPNFVLQLNSSTQIIKTFRQDYFQFKQLKKSFNKKIIKRFFKLLKSKNILCQKCRLFKLNYYKFNLAPMTSTFKYTIQILKGFLWNHPIAKMLLVVGILMGCNEQVLSQDWKSDYGFEIYFGANAEDQGQAVISTIDRGFLMVGWSEDPVSVGGDNDPDIYVVRADVDGDLVWEKRFDKGFIERGYDVVQTPDGGFLIVGETKEFPSSASKFQACLLKIDAAGNEEWFQTYGNQNGTDRGIAVIATTDGGFLFTGSTDNDETTDDDIYLIKTDSDGNQIWSKFYSNLGDDDSHSLMEMTDGYAVVGTVENPANASKDFYLLKTDFVGNQQWAKFYGTPDFDEGYDIILTQDNQIAMVGAFGSTSQVALIKTDLEGNQLWEFTFGNELGDQAFDFLQNNNGEFIIAGITEVDVSNIDILLANVSADGQTLNWTSNLGRNTHVDWGQALTRTSDGGYAIVGYNSLAFSLFFNDLTLIKTNASGSIYSNKIQGKVFVDNENCDFDNGELGLEDWLIRAASDDVTFIGTTDENGNYEINVDTGAYELSVFVNNEYWMPCVDIYNLNLTTDYDTLVRNFPMLPVVDCPYLLVNVGTAVTQNCSNVGYQLTFCNDGTVSADSAWLEVVLDENMTFNSSTLPLFSQTDSLLVFHLDTLQIGECDTMAISIATNCDVEDGITYNLNAHIFPDTICLPTENWDESSIKVNGYCDADSIRFEIENTGNGDMDEPLRYIIIEDFIMQLEQPYQLNSTQTEEITVPATGSTYRLIAEQSQNHPGNSYPTVAIEGCDNGTGNITTGAVTTYQEDENNDFVSIDVQEATELITNLSLRGYPKGYPVGGQNFIPANTALEYHILFQNTGLDTATRVVIRDTISQTLDISTIRPGTSSHPFDFEVYDNGILKITFDNIELLPDGSENGYGFVTFKIDQLPDNPEGTEIKNSAEIFMGYNAPTETATTFHHIGGNTVRDFIITDVQQVFVPEVSVNAYPNPFIEGAVIEIEGKTYQELTLTVYDLNGRLVREVKTSGHKIEFPRKELTQGMYVFHLNGDGEPVASGKLIVQ